MSRGVATALAVAVVMAGAWLGSSSTARASTLSFVPCHGNAGVLCAGVAVPLDATGVVPGIAPLAVEELPAKGTPRGVMMMVAGGPGQASALAFDLAEPRVRLAVALSRVHARRLRPARHGRLRVPGAAP